MAWLDLDLELAISIFSSFCRIEAWHSHSSLCSSFKLYSSFLVLRYQLCFVYTVYIWHRYAKLYKLWLFVKGNVIFKYIANTIYEQMKIWTSFFQVHKPEWCLCSVNWVIGQDVSLSLHLIWFTILSVNNSTKKSTLYIVVKMKSVLFNRKLPFWKRSFNCLLKWDSSFSAVTNNLTQKI